VTDLNKRNEEIAEAVKTEKPKDVADRFGLSPSHVYRIAKSHRHAAGTDNFQTTTQSILRPGAQSSGAQPIPKRMNDGGGDLFAQIGATGLRQFSGEIYEEYDRVFRPLTRKMALFREMADDHIVASTLQAIKMTIRHVEW